MTSTLPDEVREMCRRLRMWAGHPDVVREAATLLERLARENKILNAQRDSMGRTVDALEAKIASEFQPEIVRLARELAEAREWQTAVIACLNPLRKNDPCWALGRDLSKPDVAVGQIEAMRAAIDEMTALVRAVGREAVERMP